MGWITVAQKVPRENPVKDIEDMLIPHRWPLAEILMYCRASELQGRCANSHTPGCPLLNGIFYVNIDVPRILTA